VSDEQQLAPLPGPAPSWKRLVLRHPDGLHQILGASVEQPESFLAMARADVDGQSVAINLVAAKPRYYLFTVVQKPEGLGTFHEQQR
jgi:hypothetical protein